MTNEVGTEFWAKWFYDRWLSDGQLSDCAPATRGIWADAVSHMLQQKTDRISGTSDILCRKLRCNAEQLRSAFNELRDTRTANCSEDNGIITLQCRRLEREFKSLKVNALRQERFQVKKLANAIVNDSITPAGSTLLYSTLNPDMILTVYKAYPLKVGRPAAIKAIAKAIQAHGYEHVLAKTIAYATARNGDLEFTPHPSTWFNQERYNDDPVTWKPHTTGQPRTTVASRAVTREKDDAARRQIDAKRREMNAIMGDGNTPLTKDEEDKCQKLNDEILRLEKQR